MKSLSLTFIFCVLFVIPIPCYPGSVDVSGYTDKGIYVYGELDVNSDGSVDGYVYTPGGKSIYVEGEIEKGGTVEIDHDDFDGGGYELDID
jgi:hypothetical protein